MSADTVVYDLTLGQYADFEGSNDTRRERLGRVASATLEAFNTKGVSVPDLLEVLRRSGTERHLLAWSSDEAQMAGWEAIGASGELPRTPCSSR
ncbi:MAG: hypothetical protein R2716_01430 [Microthrixaceae bacterium]